MSNPTIHPPKQELCLVLEALLMLAHDKRKRDVQMKDVKQAIRKLEAWEQRKSTRRGK